MYNLVSESKTETNLASKPILAEALEKMSKEIYLQSDIAVSIQSKLHGILDKTGVPSKDEDAPQSNPVDVSSKIAILQQRLYANSEAFDRILRHLNEII